MQNVLMLILGFIIGVVLVALLSANKADEIELEKAEIYKQGYDKGFRDGCEYQIKLNGW